MPFWLNAVCSANRPQLDTRCKRSHRAGGRQAGVDLATLAANLGHRSRRVQKYVHPTADHKRQAMGTFEEALTSFEKASVSQRS